MNQAFYEFALDKIANMTDEEIWAGLQEAGIDATIRQYPEPEQKPDNEQD
jgi:3-methyladenine DNA glycosylase Tag